MPIDKHELLRRLSFIKYLYTVAAEQSNKSEPLCNIAILSFHDSIELFLQLACEHFNINSSNSGFMDYFDKLETKVVLTQKESMRRFNKTRVSLKHHGTMASKIEIDSFRVSCYNFFVENTNYVFNVNFESLSLINLITYDAPKRHLENAEKEMLSSNYRDATAEITVAFWKMIEEYEETKKRFYGRSPFFFGRDMTFLSSFFLGVNDKKLGEFVDKVKESITSMQTAIKILSFGFDYKKFTKFDLITPIYTRTMESYFLEELSNIQYNLDDTKWCFDYVIECCIILQGFDYKA